MTYLMHIKDYYTKKVAGFYYSISCIARDAKRPVKNAILMVFNRTVLIGPVLMTDNGPKCISHKFWNAMVAELENMNNHTLEINVNIEFFHNSIVASYIWPSEFRNYYDASILTENVYTDYNESGTHSPINSHLARDLRW